MATAIDIPRPATAEKDLYQWEYMWAERMVDIWREKLLHYRIRHTGALYDSLEATNRGGVAREITHRFLQYGIYVAAGTGKYYERGNGGYLQFLGLKGKHRERRPWFRPRYMASIERLNEYEARFYGARYQGLLSSYIDSLFG